MTPLDLLRVHGPMPAAKLALIAGWRLEALYGLLVPAESRGEVRLVTYEKKGSHRCLWESMEERIDHAR